MAGVSGVKQRLTPPTRAPLHCPMWRPDMAAWQATSDEEQAVSTVTAGPPRPKAKETRPLMTERVPEVAA